MWIWMKNKKAAIASGLFKSLILMVPRPLSNHIDKALILMVLTIHPLRYTPKNTPNLVAMYDTLRYEKLRLHP